MFLTILTCVVIEFLHSKVCLSDSCPSVAVVYCGVKVRSPCLDPRPHAHLFPACNDTYYSLTGAFIIAQSRLSREELFLPPRRSPLYYSACAVPRWEDWRRSKPSIIAQGKRTARRGPSCHTKYNSLFQPSYKRLGKVDLKLILDKHKYLGPHIEKNNKILPWHSNYGNSSNYLTILFPYIFFPFNLLKY